MKIKGDETEHRLRSSRFGAPARTISGTCRSASRSGRSRAYGGRGRRPGRDPACCHDRLGDLSSGIAWLPWHTPRGISAPRRVSGAASSGRRRGAAYEGADRFDRSGTRILAARCPLLCLRLHQHGPDGYAPHSLCHRPSHRRTTASAALATLAAFNMVGVLAAGVLTDRLDRGRCSPSHTWRGPRCSCSCLRSRHPEPFLFSPRCLESRTLPPFPRPPRFAEACFIREARGWLSASSRLVIRRAPRSGLGSEAGCTRLLAPTNTPSPLERWPSCSRPRSATG
jgi:hypothetical protein